LSRCIYIDSCKTRTNYAVLEAAKGQGGYVKMMQHSMSDDDFIVREYADAVKNNQNKDIYIYGAGNVAKSLYILCRDNGIDVRGFLVTDIRVNVSELYGIPVQQFDNVKMHLDKIKTLILIGVIENGAKVIENMLKADGMENVIGLSEEMCKYVSYMKNDRMIPMMEITTIVGCCVNCRYCPQDVFLAAYYKDDKKRTRVMSLEDYKVCIDKLPRNTYIHFAGFSEPFLNPDCIKMLEYTYEQGREIDLYTTLVGLTNEGFDQIKKIPFRRVVLHLADADGYADIPITQEYLELLQKVVNTKKTDGTHFVDWANCQSVPHPEVLKIVEGHLRISGELYDRAGNIENDELEHVEYITGAVECVPSQKMNRNVLLPDGTVVLCCSDFGLKHQLGNLLIEQYETIMDGTAMQQVKAACYDENMSLLCRKCAWAKKLTY